jgi:glycosyltransferase involved in cell wall biosynthesis
VPEKISNDIVFTGYLSDSEVGETMGSAYALLFLSLFEGFGVPVVEAFASGVPVVASNTSSIPEVASNAALLANPLYVSDIVSAMKLLTEDNTMRETLIQKGLERSKDFSWQKSASEMWTIIKSLLNV